jgi:hypothetical protein
LCWDSSTDGADAEATGGLKGYGLPFWSQIVPGPFPITRKPGGGTLEIQAVARISQTDVVDLQIVTRAQAARFNSRARSTDKNVIRLTGDGTTNWLTFSRVLCPCSDTLFDSVAIFARGVVTSRALDVGTYGSPASGIVDSATPAWILDVGANWNTSGATMELAHAIVFRDASGNAITTPRLIVAVQAEDELQIFPPLEGMISARALVGASYAIYELPTWRVANLVAYSEDRTA